MPLSLKPALSLWADLDPHYRDISHGISRRRFDHLYVQSVDSKGPFYGLEADTQSPRAWTKSMTDNNRRDLRKTSPRRHFTSTDNSMLITWSIWII